MQPSVRDDLQHYYLPIGVLGLVNQVVNIYIYSQFLMGNCPLWPRRELQHKSYNKLLCIGAMVFVVAYDSTSLSRLHRWELIVSVVGNLIIFLNFIIMVCFSGSSKHREAMRAKAASDPRTDAETPTPQGDEPPPPYSKDPEKGDAIVSDPAQTSELGNEHIPDQEIGCPEYPAPETSGAETRPAGSSSTPEEAEKGVTSSLPTQIQADTKAEVSAIASLQSAGQIDLGGFIFYLVFQIPGTALLLTGLVGQLTLILPDAWASIDHIRPIIIIFGIFIATTLLVTLFYIVRLNRQPASSDEVSIAKRKGDYLDHLLKGVLFFNFFLVSFDEWLLAALGNDITGAKHILSDGGLPLVYLFLSKLPALAL
ncbi:hypothetical protein F5B22DRAFT_271526 [Xylaria bambusicola]|uniref:uncharacterized protein n=1 Tax=Xylaria bambusicola TaxID=326684 RepID=UPI002008D2D7|nr:uncharacterized protein F5B22DRAFT_271526 [Xylaria bambusicola]KAI0513089.1 hypothetical protein F5B22DRAFT_271526 [Xylaria bambusicola]